jgi:polyisoprenoid-binding protein YceI
MGIFNRAKSDSDTDTTTGSDLSHLTGTYTIDPTHSEIGFSVRHAMVTTVRGQLAEYDGKLVLDGAKPAASTAEVTIKVVSIDTNQEQRDGHLRTGDFFDAETHPEITFVSTAAEQLDDETYRLTGDLTIKGISKPVSIDFTLNGSAKDLYGNERVGFEGSTTINRTDWGLSYNAALETGGVLIGEKVKLNFDISAIKAA